MAAEASRETELTERFPLHVVCAWIGNSRPVAVEHYLQVTDQHFEQAVQNPAQYASAQGRRPPQPDSTRGIVISTSENNRTLKRAKRVSIHVDWTHPWGELKGGRS